MASYKLFYPGSGDATVNRAAQVQIQADGELYLAQIELSATALPNDAGGFARCEISANPDQSFDTNNARGVVACAAISNGGADSLTAVVPGTVNVVVPGLRIPVRLGDMVYVHAKATGAVEYVIEAIIHVDDYVRPVPANPAQR